MRHLPALAACFAMSACAVPLERLGHVATPLADVLADPVAMRVILGGCLDPADTIRVPMATGVTVEVSALGLLAAGVGRRCP